MLLIIKASAPGGVGDTRLSRNGRPCDRVAYATR